MVELAGFPEIAILSLLYYRAGGTAGVSTDDFTDTDDNNNDDKVDDSTSINRESGNNIEFNNDPNAIGVDSIFLNSTDNWGCGCGMKHCGKSSCFVVLPSLNDNKYNSKNPFSPRCSTTLEQVLNSLSKLCLDSNMCATFAAKETREEKNN
uniref:Uncharacterized protein n=1 Tax=Ditylum brightwellii TaxID=49249 RepID=A0A7S2ED52_9STRA|mmetsp:Transcript_24379/g.36372  ORF Transcript_24379/g.36372 Transcript_24379/m.36372 type:complete len:151 (+) Transcript_24379:511-963(+)